MEKSCCTSQSFLMSVFFYSNKTLANTANAIIAHINMEIGSRRMTLTLCGALVILAYLIKLSKSFI